MSSMRLLHKADFIENTNPMRMSAPRGENNNLCYMNLSAVISVLSGLLGGLVWGEGVK